METMCFSSINMNLDINSNDQPLNVDNIEDSDLITALNLCVERGHLTPIIKKELKYFVQARRLADGKDELTVNFNPPVKFELETRDEVKIARRREQNRRAAERFRKKNKTKRAGLDKELIQEQTRNAELCNRVKNLTMEINLYRSIIHVIIKNTMETVSTTQAPDTEDIP